VKRKKEAPPGPFDALRAMKQKLEEEETRKASARPSSADRPRADAKRAVERPPESPTPRGPEDEDEALLMARMFAGVTPLDRSVVARHRPPDEPLPDANRVRRAADEAQTEADDVRERLRALVEDKPRFEVADDGVHVEGRRLDVPVDVLRRLRRGSYPIDGRLDLHGMSAAQARGELDAFLRTMRARGERSILVIHGKGDHSPQGLGVLRGEISAWLSQGSASDHVSAFATAQAGDGGGGAVYVLLRR